MTVSGKAIELEREAIVKRLRAVKPEPIRTHAVEVAGRLYPVKQAFAEVTGMHVLDFNTLQARSAFRKLGFKVTPSGS